MEENLKQLLLKDLSARLPYNVVIRCTDNDTDYKCFLTTNILNELLHNTEYYDYKPYLRPMSSMTEEEFHNSPIYGNDVRYSYKIDKDGFHFIRIETYDNEVFDWLNSHHFDYRGLIKKGLAIDCTNLDIY